MIGRLPVLGLSSHPASHPSHQGCGRGIRHSRPAKKHVEFLRRSAEIAAKEASDAVASAQTAALLAVSGIDILADQLGHSAADRTNELAGTDSSRDVIQAANLQIAQTIAARATAASPQQALNGIAGPSDDVSWSNL